MEAGGTRHVAARARLATALLVAGIATPGCRDAVAPSGLSGPTEVEPRAGRYVVAEFEYRNACADRDVGLSSRTATAHSATFDLEQRTDRLGSLVLSGTLQVPSPDPGATDVVIFEGPDTGQYRISGDTLRLWFPKEVNEWVGVLRFARYQAGQLAGSSRTNCRSLTLRLELRP